MPFLPPVSKVIKIGDGYPLVGWHREIQKALNDLKQWSSRRHNFAAISHRPQVKDFQHRRAHTEISP